MTYLGTLVACLTGQIEPKNSYFTNSGSCHTVEYDFPDLLHKFHTPREFKPIKVDMIRWTNWREFSLKNYSKDNLCIIKEGWSNTDCDIWSEGLNSTENSYAIISSPNSKLDWIYCWLNQINKTPRHLYKTLLHRSKFFPKIWNTDGRLKIVPKHIKIDEMQKAMPSHIIEENIITFRPTFRFRTTDILEEKFPEKLYQFLHHYGIVSNLTPQILAWHNQFRELQQFNFERAKLIAENQSFIPLGPFEEILQRYLTDRDPWATTEHPMSLSIPS